MRHRCSTQHFEVRLLCCAMQENARSVTSLPPAFLSFVGNSCDHSRCSEARPHG